MRITSLLPARGRGLKSLAHNKDGISAVEFAIIAPLMVMVFFGCAELSFLMQADRRVTAATSSLGDLVARDTSIDNADVDIVFDAASFILAPMPIASAKMRFSSLQENNGSVEVVWSDHKNWSSRPVGATVVTPAGLVPTGGTVILAEMEYTYTSSIGFFIHTSKTLGDQFYLRPRRVDSITRDTS